MEENDCNRDFRRVGPNKTQNTYGAHYRKKMGHGRFTCRGREAF